LWAFVASVDYDGIVVVVEAEVVAGIDEHVADIAFEFARAGILNV